MNGKQLKNSILQWAIQGRLVPQDPTDEPASVLLQRILAEKAKLVKEGKLKKSALSDSHIFRGEDNKYYEKVGKTVTCIDEDIPFAIPETWEWVRLGDISDYNGQKLKIKAQLAPLDTWILDLEDIEKGGKVLSVKTIGERKPIGDKTVFKKGQILYSKLRPYLLKILVAPCNGLCTSEIVPFSVYDNISVEYIVTLLKTPYVDNLINCITYGIKMPRVGTGTMCSLLLPLPPPLAEQHRIVAKVEELLSVVERYEKAQDALDALCNSLDGRLRKSILSEAIRGHLVPQDPTDEPASLLLRRIQAEKAKLVKEGKLKKSALGDSRIFRGEDNKYYEQNGKTITCIDEQIPFEIPESWEWVRLGNVVSTSIGKTPERGNQAYWSNGIYNWVAIADMIDGGIINSTKEKVSQIAADNCLGDITPAGSLIMSFKLTIGRTSILGCNAYHNEAIVTLRPYVDTNNAFRNYLLHIMPKIANTGDAKEAIKGKTLNSKSIFNLLLPLPPLAEQQRIVSKVEELFAVLDRLACK